MALITKNGFEICNKNDYDLFFDNIVNGEVKNNFNDNEIKDIIEAKNRQKAGKTLPPQGLFLMNVEYN